MTHTIKPTHWYLPSPHHPLPERNRNIYITKPESNFFCWMDSTIIEYNCCLVTCIISWGHFSNSKSQCKQISCQTETSAKVMLALSDTNFGMGGAEACVGKSLPVFIKNSDLNLTKSRAVFVVTSFSNRLPTITMFREWQRTDGRRGTAEGSNRHRIKGMF